MADKKEVNAFARRYLALLTDHNTQERTLKDGFAESAAELGFLMDGGRGFVEQFGDEAYDSVNGLLDVIDKARDPDLLGSAVYSKWRYVTNWSNESLLDESNRLWLMTAFGRMAELTRPEYSAPATLTGTVDEARIISNGSLTGKRRALGPQSEERLTIRSDGTVELSIVHFNADPGGHRVVESLPATAIPSQSARRILDALTRQFRYAYGGEDRDADIEAAPGNWKVILTNSLGRPFTASGPLGAKFDEEGVDISDLIRRLTGRPQLLAFDGNPDLVNRIEVRYRRGTRKGGEITWVAREQIVFDRRTESVDHRLEEVPGKRGRSTYHIQGGVSSFLDTFDELSFTGVAGNPPDVIEDENEVNAYEIAIFTRHGNNRLIHGTYDRRALPRDWEEFIDKILTFLGFYGYGELFDAERYGKAKRRASDFIYARVVFADREGEYAYLTDDASLRMDDLVMAPLGPSDVPTPGQITEILYGDVHEAPYPFGRLKRILRKCTEEDLRELEAQKGTRSPS